MSRAPGFLLIELLIGLSALCIVILAAGGYFYQISRLQSEGIKRMQAVSIARTAMEHLVAGKAHLIAPVQEQFTVEWKLDPDMRNSFSNAHVIVSWLTQKKARIFVILEAGVAHANA